MFFELLIAFKRSRNKNVFNKLLHFSNNLVCCWSFVAGSLMRMNGLQSSRTDPISHSHHPLNGRLPQKYKVIPLPQLFCLMRYHKMSTVQRCVVRAAEDKIFGILVLKHGYTLLSTSLSQYNLNEKNASSLRNYLQYKEVKVKQILLSRCQGVGGTRLRRVFLVFYPQKELNDKLT